MLLYQNLAGVVEAGFMKTLPFVAAIEAETVGLSPVVSFDSVIKKTTNTRTSERRDKSYDWFLRSFKPALYGH